VTLDREVLEDALRARDESIGRQLDAERAQVNYQHAIRRLHASGASLREIAEALGLSHQRVHQIVETVTGKTAIKESIDAKVCSFCGKSKEDTEKLVAGPGVFICDACIFEATDLTRRGETQDLKHSGFSLISDGKTKCSFCGKRAKKTGPLAAAFGTPSASVRRTKFGGVGVRICSECLGLCNEIVGETRESV
jgi:hypothetical protein